MRKSSGSASIGVMCCGAIMDPPAPEARGKEPPVPPAFAGKMQAGAPRPIATHRLRCNELPTVRDSCAMTRREACRNFLRRNSLRAGNFSRFSREFRLSSKCVLSAKPIVHCTAISVRCFCSEFAPSPPRVGCRCAGSLPCCCRRRLIPSRLFSSFFEVNPPTN
jgi:hypothetical protein